MIKFKKLQKDDFNTVNKYLLLDKTRSCEKVGAALMMWRDFYNIEWSIYEQTLIIRYLNEEKDETAYLVPIGENVEKTVQALGKVVYTGVCKENIEKVADKDSEIIPVRDNFDYIYSAEALRTFSGKKLHAKKNFLNRFQKTYKYEFSLSPDKDELIEFFKFIDEKYPHYDETGVAELNETIDMIENSELFGATMGAIKVDGRVVAATVGTKIRDTLYVHIEKADREYAGAYQAIVSEFVKAFDGIEYVNREDDLGDDGMRQSKLSYNPLYLLEKHIVKR
ncbi:MAG: DUF2156 domain-containing protein [Clostridia bacterium]|nr:DUF2156 domain-containing protein [Clostridia bacterium]